MTPAATGKSGYWLGTGLMALTAGSIAFVSPLSVQVYDAGGNALTQVLLRSAAFSLVVGASLLVAGRSFRLSRRTLVATVWMAGALLTMSLGYLGSVAYIPVSVAVLLLFTSPLIVLVLSTATGHEAVTWTKASTMLLAFAGLALALGPSFADLDWRGVVLVLAAAVGVAITNVFSGDVMRDNDPMVVICVANLWIALLLVPVAWWGGWFALPSTGAGMAAMATSVGCFVVACSAWFYAVRLISPIRIALITNLEPAITISLAALLLGERLGPQELAGIAIVLAALIAGAVTGRQEALPARR